MLLRAISLFFFCFILSFDAFSISQDELDAIKALLKTQHKIRILTGSAPGHGHQSANLQVMRKLKSLGFNGLFEVVYRDENMGIGSHGPYPANMLKPFAQILPGLMEKNKEFMTTDNMRVKMLPVSDYLKKGGDKVLINLSGAIDDIDIIYYFAKNDQFVLTLSPDKWTDKGEVFHDEKFFSSFSTDGLHYFPQIANPENPLNFIAEAMDYAGFKNKILGLQEIIKAHKEHEFLAAYGLGFHGVDKIVKIVSALGSAKKLRSDLFKKGIIIGMISNLNDAETTRISTLLLRKGYANFKIISITDKNIAQALQNIKKDDIVLVKVGNVPQNVFEYLFAHSTLPPTVAGYNAVSLMKYLGTPYLSMVLDKDITPAIDLVHEATREIILNGGNSLINFYLASKDKESAMVKKFKAMGDELRRNKEDKLPFSLLKLLQAMEDYYAANKIEVSSCSSAANKFLALGQLLK